MAFKGRTFPVEMEALAPQYMNYPVYVPSEAMKYY
jgi:hypothetical protein